MSSSAQLTLLPWLLGWPPVADRTGFAAGLHAGSTVGLALALRDDLRDLTPTDVRRIALSSIPAGLVGALAHDAVERRLGRPRPTAALLAAAGALMWLADRSALERDLTPGDTAVAAVAQVAALAPGVSRTGATLTVLRARGVDREQALRWSLLMSLPVTAGAAALTAVRARAVPPAVPTAVAAATAYVTATRMRPTRRTIAAATATRVAVAAAVLAKSRLGSRS